MRILFALPFLLAAGFPGIGFPGIGFSAIGTAQAQPPVACHDMVFPVAQLKTVGRGLSAYHAGIDLMAPWGSPVQAADAGTVSYAGWYFGYGNMIDIQHPDGSMTRYGHLSRIDKRLRPGAVVRRGEVIGNVGATGYAHGAHLHFEVRLNGRPVDPKPFIQLAACFHQPQAPAPAQQASTTARQPDRFVVATHASESAR